MTRINPGSNRAQSQAITDCSACIPDLDGLLAASPELATVWTALPRRSLRKGQALVQIGQAVKQVWRIESGLLRMYYISPEGLDRNRSFHGSGEWLGAGVPPIETDSPYAIEALEASVVVALPYPVLQDLLARHVNIVNSLQNALAMIFTRQNQRVSELLLLDAGARYGAFLDFYGELAARVPLHHVASYLGITNVALSRIRRRLKQGLAD